MENNCIYEFKAGQLTDSFGLSRNLFQSIHDEKQAFRASYLWN